MATLTHSGYDDLAVASKNEVYYMIELFVEILYLLEYGLCLILQATLGNLSVLNHFCFLLVHCLGPIANELLSGTLFGYGLRHLKMTGYVLIRLYK